MEPRYQILAVDDEQFSLVLLRSCLQDENCHLVTCDNALAALEEIKRHEFDVVLLDIMLGAIDGFELRKLIRDLNPKLPIIFLTSLLDDIDSRLINRIADDRYSYYLNKSFKKHQLLDKIEHAVRLYREEQEAVNFYRHLDLELGLAREVQRVLLPLWCSLTDDMLMTYLYEPCFRVSGDTFELISLEDGRHLFFLGDIVGHGVQAALYMSAIQSYLKVLPNVISSRELAPHVVLNRLHDFYHHNLRGDSHMTCLVAIFDFRENRLQFQTAGHPGIIQCSRSRRIASVIAQDGRGGFPIGWFREKTYLPEDNIERLFADDDVFLLYTDGLLDLENESGQTVDFSLILGLLGAFAEQEQVVSIPFQLRSALEQIGFQQQKDDISIVGVGKNPEMIWADKNTAAKPQMLGLLKLQTAEVSQCVKKLGQFVWDQTEDADLATRVELLLSEFLNNVIEHDEESHPSLQSGILVMVRMLSHQQVQITILDRQPKEVEHKLEVLENAEEVLEHCNRTRTSSGRGLAIIQTVASNIMRKHFRGLNQTDFLVNGK